MERSSCSRSVVDFNTQPVAVIPYVWFVCFLKVSSCIVFEVNTDVVSLCLSQPTGEMLLIV